MNNSRFNKAASILLAVTVVQGACGVSAFAAEANPDPAPGIVITDGGDAGFKDGSAYADYARKAVFSDAKSYDSDLIQSTDFAHSRADAFETKVGVQNAEAAAQHLLQTSANLNKDKDAPVVAHHDDSLSLANEVSASPAKIAGSFKDGTLLSDLRPDVIKGGVSQSFTVDTVTGPKSGFSYAGTKDDKVSAGAKSDLAGVNASAERTKNDTLAVKPVVQVPDTLAAILPTVKTDTVHNAAAGFLVDNKEGHTYIQTAVGTKDKDGKIIPDENKIDVKNAFGEITSDTKAAGSTTIVTGTPKTIKEGLAGKSLPEIAVGLIPEGTVKLGEASSITNTLDKTGVGVATNKGANSNATLKNDLGAVIHQGAVVQDNSATVKTPAVIANSGLVEFIPSVTNTIGQAGTVETTVDNKQNSMNVKTDNIVYDSAKIQAQDISVDHAAQAEVKNEVTTASPAGIISTLKGTEGISSFIGAVKAGSANVEVKGGHSFSFTKNADGTATVKNQNSGTAGVNATSAIGSASHTISAGSSTTATVPTLAKLFGHFFRTPK